MLRYRTLAMIVDTKVPAPRRTTHHSGLVHHGRRFSESTLIRSFLPHRRRAVPVAARCGHLERKRIQETREEELERPQR